MCSPKSVPASSPMSAPLMGSTPFRPPCPRPAWCASTRTDIPSMPARRDGPSRSGPTPIAWNAGRDGRIVASHARAFGRGKTIYDPLHYIPVLTRKPGALRNGAPFKDWDLPPASRPRPAPVGRKARRRSADGGDPGRRPERRPRRRGGGLCRGACRQRPLRRRRSQHPGPPPRTATGPDHHDPGRAAAGPRAGRRLQPI